MFAFTRGLVKKDHGDEEWREKCEVGDIIDILAGDNLVRCGGCRFYEKIGDSCTTPPRI
jgi:hypothetical protein